jgi:holo-[acyl-carrier protein] synthase
VTAAPLRTAVVLLEVARVEALLARFGARFLERIFTPEEQQGCLGRRNEAERLACRLAAKQAVRRVLARRPWVWPVRRRSRARRWPAAGRSSRSPMTGGWRQRRW